jgi:site-specific DNA-methyltransferase (adenine-specific)
MDVHFSSKSPEWETPADLFEKLNAEFNFTLDVCATGENAKCALYFTPAVDGLKQGWAGQTCWMNPPYGREIGAWVAKAEEEAARGATVVCLLPARTDTRWFHRWIWDAKRDRPRRGVKLRLLQGRLTFSNAEASAPFPSCIVVFKY